MNVLAVARGLILCPNKAVVRMGRAYESDTETNVGVFSSVTRCGRLGAASLCVNESG